jgi:hypothetical protein
LFNQCNGSGECYENFSGGEEVNSQGIINPPKSPKPAESLISGAWTAKKNIVVAQIP